MHHKEQSVVNKSSWILFSGMGGSLYWELKCWQFLHEVDYRLEILHIDDGFESNL